MRGIDISHWQTRFNVSQTPVPVVICKASGGNSYKDLSFKHFAETALASGKLLGFYHFAKDGCNSQSGKAEADFFYSIVKPYIGKGIPILDLEDNALLDWATYTYAFITRFKELSGVYPIIYTGLDGIKRCKAIPYIFKNCPVWFAGYPLGYINYWLPDTANPRSYYEIDKAANIVMWQFTSAISMQGMNVDANLIYMTNSEWKAYAKGEVMANNIGYDVWSYRNKKLEKQDAYGILRDIRDKVTTIEKRITALEKKVK